MKPVVLTHGGAASPSAMSDGCATAGEAARAILDRGGHALEAALAATAMLEDDPRFNAGTGSNLRFDGVTVEMDAAVATSDGRFAAVACIQRVRNPVLVAAKLLDTPHLMLVGDGATAFARRHGFEDFDPITDRSRDKHARALAELAGRGDGDYAVDALPWRRGGVAQHWNFPGDPPEVGDAKTANAAAVAAAAASSTAPRAGGARGDRGCDTVGAVVRDAQGHFAATASTGGTVYMLKGRVGDSPLLGCGLYAGPHGAVAATGVGEEIVRRFLARTVYDWLAEGLAPARAAQRAIAMFPDVIDVGVLVAGKEGHAIASNRDMASAHVGPK